MIRRAMPMARRLWCRSYYMWRDIPYTVDAHPQQILDIVVPKNPKFPRHLLPVNVFVHGGAWQRGHKDGTYYASVAPAIAQQTGTIVVKINYRLSPEVQYPGHVHDTLHALQWIQQEIHKYGGDPNKLILIGHSAGAHAVMKLIIDPVTFPNCPKVIGAIGISGVYNILRLSRATFFGSLVIDPVFGKSVQAWREASVMQPSFYDTSNIPILLMYAEDDFHFGEDAKELQKWLESNGNTQVECKVIPDCNHLSIIGNVNNNEPKSNSTKAITDFIRDVIQKGN